MTPHFLKTPETYAAHLEAIAEANGVAARELPGDLSLGGALQVDPNLTPV